MRRLFRFSFLHTLRSLCTFRHGMYLIRGGPPKLVRIVLHYDKRHSFSPQRALLVYDSLHIVWASALPESLLCLMCWCLGQGTSYAMTWWRAVPLLHYSKLQNSAGRLFWRTQRSSSTTLHFWAELQYNFSVLESITPLPPCTLH